MNQQTFSDVEDSGRCRMTKREEFLDIMNDIIPWDEWIAHGHQLHCGECT